MQSRIRPYARRYLRRQNARTYARRPRQPGVSLRLYAPARADMDTYRTIIAREVSLTVNAGGITSQQVQFNTVSSSANWASLAVLFDEFKVEAVQINYTPLSPNSVITNGFPPIHVAFDADGAATVPTVSEILTYGSATTFRLDQAWSKLYTITTDRQARDAWYDTALASEQPETVLFSAQNGFAGPGTWGILTVRYYTKFRGSR